MHVVHEETPGVSPEPGLEGALYTVLSVCVGGAAVEIECDLTVWAVGFLRSRRPAICRGDDFVVARGAAPRYAILRVGERTGFDP